MSIKVDRPNVRPFTVLRFCLMLSCLSLPIAASCMWVVAYVLVAYRSSEEAAERIRASGHKGHLAWCAGDWWPRPSYGHARARAYYHGHGWQPPYIIHTSDIYFEHLDQMSSFFFAKKKKKSCLVQGFSPSRQQYLPTHMRWIIVVPLYCRIHKANIRTMVINPS